MIYVLQLTMTNSLTLQDPKTYDERHVLMELSSEFSPNQFKSINQDDASMIDNWNGYELEKSRFDARAGKRNLFTKRRFSAWAGRR